MPAPHDLQPHRPPAARPPSLADPDGRGTPLAMPAGQGLLPMSSDWDSSSLRERDMPGTDHQSTPERELCVGQHPDPKRAGQPDTQETEEERTMQRRELVSECTVGS